MALIVVGGNARKVGKTGVAAALMAALPEFHWTAVKITQLHAGECALGREGCQCTATEHTVGIREQCEASPKSDTARYLIAGAARALWLRTKPGALAQAMPELQRRLAGCENVMVESNSAMQFLQPDLYLMVMDFAVADFKSSARAHLRRADAFVVTSAAAPWPKVSAVLQSKPQFRVTRSGYTSPELVQWVRGRLQHPEKAGDQRKATNSS